MLRLTGNRETVEDLTQEVFLRLFRALPGFRGEAQVSTYLYRITVNVAQDEWKRRRRVERPLRSLSDEEAGWGDRLRHPARNAEEAMADEEFAQAVDRELLKLSEVERAVLVLYHQEEQSYAAIATVLGVPVNTVRTHLHRGRSRLREALRAMRGRDGESGGEGRDD